MIILRRNFLEAGIRITPETTSDDELVCRDITVGGIYMEAGNSQSFEMNAPYKLMPGSCVVVQTAEQFSIPDGFFGILCSKGSLTNRGLFVPNTKIDPLFSGKLDVAIYNAGQSVYTVKQGVKFCSVIFLRLEDLTRSEAVRSSPRTVMERPGFLSRMWELHAPLIIGGIVTIVISVAGSAIATYVTNVMMDHK